jgi:membrane protease YdiL (CAAX protease family)
MILRIVIFYVLTWFFLILLGGIQQATGLLPPEIGLAQWGPGIAGLLMLVLFRKDGFRIRFTSRETPAFRYLLAALLPFGVALCILLVRAAFTIEPSANAPAYTSVLALLLWMPFGALGEELGWRGYLHKKLDPRMPGLLSSLLVGILWMPIHVTFLARGPVFVFLLTVLIVSYSVVIYALVQDTGFSVILASIFHLSINLSNLLFLDVIYETSFMMINALVWAGVAITVVLLERRLFFARKGSDEPG